MKNQSNGTSMVFAKKTKVLSPKRRFQHVRQIVNRFVNCKSGMNDEQQRYDDEKKLKDRKVSLIAAVSTIESADLPTPPTPKFYAGYGTSNHMVNDQNLLINQRRTEQSIQSMNGSVRNTIIGDLPCEVFNGKQWIKSVISDVLFIPDQPFNVISIGQLCREKGFNGETDSEGMILYRHDQPMMIADWSDQYVNMFELRLRVEQNTAPQTIASNQNEYVSKQMCAAESSPDTITSTIESEVDEVGRNIVDESIVSCLPGISRRVADDQQLPNRHIGINESNFNGDTTQFPSEKMMNIGVNNKIPFFGFKRIVNEHYVLTGNNDILSWTCVSREAEILLKNIGSFPIDVFKSSFSNRGIFNEIGHIIDPPRNFYDFNYHYFNMQHMAHSVMAYHQSGSKRTESDDVYRINDLPLLIKSDEILYNCQMKMYRIGYDIPDLKFYRIFTNIESDDHSLMNYQPIFKCLIPDKYPDLNRLSIFNKSELNIFHFVNRQMFFDPVPDEFSVFNHSLWYHLIRSSFVGHIIYEYYFGQHSIFSGFIVIIFYTPKIPQNLIFISYFCQLSGQTINGTGMTLHRHDKPNYLLTDHVVKSLKIFIDHVTADFIDIGSLALYCMSKRFNLPQQEPYHHRSVIFAKDAVLCLARHGIKSGFISSELPLQHGLVDLLIRKLRANQYYYSRQNCLLFMQNFGRRIYLTNFRIFTFIEYSTNNRDENIVKSVKIKFLMIGYFIENYSCYRYYRRIELSDPITIYEKVSWKSSHQSYLKKFTDFTAINALYRFKVNIPEINVDNGGRNNVKIITIDSGGSILNFLDTNCGGSSISLIFEKFSGTGNLIIAQIIYEQSYRRLPTAAKSFRRQNDIFLASFERSLRTTDHLLSNYSPLLFDIAGKIAKPILVDPPPNEIIVSRKRVDLKIRLYRTIRFDDLIISQIFKLIIVFIVFNYFVKYLFDPLDETFYWLNLTYEVDLRLYLVSFDHIVSVLQTMNKPKWYNFISYLDVLINFYKSTSIGRNRLQNNLDFENIRIKLYLLFIKRLIFARIVLLAHFLLNTLVNIKTVKRLYRYFDWISIELLDLLSMDYLVSLI
ncbi:hypothetical protein HUG17_8035 [Dermatophagoides farinae]|uniref:Retrovirus-related Pol polyprotein from transposon TNT 1-94-like beta-barrel domain-containing protein n=1 Tax=Dermatophagoides farinae TaxID=6954 RepID=A0A9D4SG77_DERFA|nr:hypothetical protein HUG17_8035 [Dermatophagoides farinae]